MQFILFNIKGKEKERWGKPGKSRYPGRLLNHLEGLNFSCYLLVKNA